MKRALSLGISVASVVALTYAAVRFPWRESGHSLAGAHAGWLLLAAMANLASLVAKGSSWHLLIRQAAPVRLTNSIAATVVGAAAGSIGPSVTGEAARLKLLMSREPVSLRTAMRGLIAARLLEALSLMGLIAAGSAALPDVPWARAVRIGAIASLCIGGIVTRPAVLGRLAPGLASAAGERGTTGALALTALNWIAQWATYYFACRAVSVPAPLALSLAALVLANVGGVLRLTPGNVGVLQAAFAISALRLAVPPARAVAASFLLQAIQILPVLLAAGVVLAMHATRPNARLPGPAVPA